MTDQFNVTLLQQFENNFFSYFNIYLKVKDQLDKQSRKNDYFTDAYHSLSSMVKYSDLQGKTASEAYESKLIIYNCLSYVCVIKSFILLSNHSPKSGKTVLPFSSLQL